MVPTKHGILLLHMNIFEEDLAATTTHVIIMGSDSTLKIQPPSKLPRLVFILVADIGSRLRSKYADPWIPSRFSGRELPRSEYRDNDLEGKERRLPRGELLKQRGRGQRLKKKGEGS
ncbi:hypothetical protein VNO77_27637 [Canavalia gladiata]|uniref:Uncharacterized protein n=1 Tax=Canavalia gladiata TaxID=3824 RepID=A0AAN9KUH2_CANGL